MAHRSRADDQRHHSCGEVRRALGRDGVLGRLRHLHSAKACATSVARRITVSGGGRMEHPREVTTATGGRRWVARDGRSFASLAEAQAADRETPLVAGDPTGEPAEVHEPIFPWANAEALQPLVTSITLLVVFAACWIYAIGAWGWFIGLSLGWIPSAILAAAAGWLAFKLWSIVLGLALLLVTLLIYGMNT